MSCARNIIIVILLKILMISNINAEEILTFTSPAGKYVPLVSQEIIIEAYKRIGIKVKIIMQPAERAIKQANNGIHDGVLNRILGVERKYHNLEIIPISINAMSIGVFSKKSTFEVNNWDSLIPYKVAIRRGIKSVETKLPKDLMYESVTNAKQIFLMIDLERVDVGIYPIGEGMIIIKELGLQNIKLLKPSLETSELYHYLHKKHKKLIPKITTILKEMRINGEIQKIRDKVNDNLGIKIY